MLENNDLVENQPVVLETQKRKISLLEQIQKYGWVASLILSISAAGFSIYNLRLIRQIGSSAPTVSGTSTQNVLTISQFYKELKGNEPALGDPNAPVTIVEFADYQCPYCKKFFDQTFSGIKQKYIDSGKVRFVFVNTAVLGQESIDAAQAAKCAGDQNEYWAYHDYLYNHQKGENLGNFSKNNLIDFARLLKLDSTQFENCLNTDKYAAEITRETSLAQKYSITGTPMFFIEDRMIRGSQPELVFENVINGLLAK